MCFARAATFYNVLLKTTLMLFYAKDTHVWELSNLLSIEWKLVLQPPFYIVLNMMRQTPMRDDARLNVGKYIHSLLYLLQKCYATTPAVSDLFMTNVVFECISSYEYVSWYNFLLLYSKIRCRYVHFRTWMEGCKSGVVMLKVECFR